MGTKIFSETEEADCVQYLLTASKNAARLLAYNFTTKNGKTMPGNWRENKTAGKEWLYYFMKRHRT